jgi:hypothetical protein
VSTNRELLEFAAKAAGLRLTWGEKYKIGDDEVDCTDMPYALGDSPDESPAYWNPLEDDGDALRLAVKRGITLHAFHDHHQGAQVVAVAPAHREVREHAEDHGDDIYAATRRAIVRAAAEIGKAIS